MSYYPYSRENSKLWFTAKESSFRTNATGKDTWKADAVVYPMPVVDPLVFEYIKKQNTYIYVPNVGPDPGMVYTDNYGEGMLTISGKIQNYDLMYFIHKACATSGPAGSIYTHTYASTTARPATVPSFQMIRKLENDTAAQGVWILYTGCVVKSINIKGSVGANDLEGSITILFANSILTTTDLSGTQTERDALRFYQFSTTAITFSKGGVAYQADVMGFEINYDDGTWLHKAANESRPERAYNGPRLVTVKLDIAPKEKAIIDDLFASELAPATASDVDITIKTSRSTTEDYMEWAFEKLWHIERGPGDFTMNNYYLMMPVTYLVKPTQFEASAKFTVTVKNLKDNTRFEGA